MTITKSFHRRRLPHFQPGRNPVFITFRLAGSLPKSQTDTIDSPADKLTTSPDEGDNSFGKWDLLLDRAETGPTWLKKPIIAQILKDSLHYSEKDHFNLICYSIMPNHVHLVLEQIQVKEKLFDLLRNIKGFTARKANKVLKRSGAFWQDEYFDRVIRPGKLLSTTRYVLENPVKAGLVNHWRDWPHSYLAESYLSLMK